MKGMLIAMVILAACGDPETKDTPEVAAAKAECHQLFVHVTSISPQAAGQDPEKIVAGFPVEETEECRVSEHEVRACIIAAPDVAGVRKCVPSDEVFACMGAASGAKLPDVRAECWAKRDDKAAIKGLNDKLACVAKATDKQHPEVASKCLADAKAADAL
jgi:hypothetical protein